MSTPDPADVLVARAADRIAVIAMRKDAAAALELVLDLHEHRADVQICLRYDVVSKPERKRSPMPARYPGRCAVCAGNVSVGESVYWDGESRQLTHARCA